MDPFTYGVSQGGQIHVKRKDESLGYTLLDYARHSSDWDVLAVRSIAKKAGTATATVY